MLVQCKVVKQVTEHIVILSSYCAVEFFCANLRQWVANGDGEQEEILVAEFRTMARH